MDKIKKSMRKIAIGMIDAYRYFIKPFLAYNCRFYPSCSCYCKTAIIQHGIIKGGWLGFKRIIRCNPWFKGGGHDPVPGEDRDKTINLEKVE